MLALGVEHDGLDARRAGWLKNASMPSTVGSLSALRFAGAGEPQHGDLAVPFDLQRRRQRGGGGHDVPSGRDPAACSIGCSSAARCRSSTRRILPVALCGSSATNSRYLGTL